MKRLALIFFVLSAVTVSSRAAELKLFTVRAITTILWEIGPEFERSSGHKLNVVTGFSPAFTTLIRGGEPFDLVFAPMPAIDALIKEYSSPPRSFVRPEVPEEQSPPQQQKPHNDF